VFRPGKTVEVTDTPENPFLDFPADFMPEKMKSSTVAKEEFLHGRKGKENPVVGIQKSRIGSESDEKAEGLLQVLLLDLVEKLIYILPEDSKELLYC
jgi:hypothetical protein